MSQPLDMILEPFRYISTSIRDDVRIRREFFVVIVFSFFAGGMVAAGFYEMMIADEYEIEY